MSESRNRFRSARTSHRRSPPLPEKRPPSNRLYPRVPNDAEEPGVFDSPDANSRFYTEDSSSSSLERSLETESDHSDVETSADRSRSFVSAKGSPTVLPSAGKRPSLQGSHLPENGVPKWGLLLLVVGTLIFALYFLLPQRPVGEPDVPVVKRYRQQMARLLKEKYPKEKSNTRSILRLIGEKWIDQEPKEPYVVLITGSEARSFASDITDEFTKLLRRGEVDVIYCDAHKERSMLDDEIAFSLSKPSKTVVLSDIDRLRGDTPLSLHSLCDPDHSSHPSALVLLTVTRPNLGPYPECEHALSRLLLNEWKTGFMDEDRISPILSRITSYVICLES